MASMKNKTRFVDWANIEGDVLRCIADMTDAAWDLIRMTAVCRSWQASLANKRIKFPICLMLTEGYYSNEHCFYSISEAIFDVLYLSEIQGRRCWGSPFGWLVTYAFDFQTRLFNPFSRNRIPLPSLSTIADEEDCSPGELFKSSLRKLILCTSPEESDCIVLANTSDGWFFAKPSDEAWTLIGLSDHNDLDDAIYFKGNFYGRLHTGEIVLCEATHPKFVEFAPPPPDLPYFYPGIIINYLFGLGGNLCIACRHIDTYCGTVGFVIFKLDMDTKSWEKIYSLGDRSLFLGNCSTFAIAAADYPGCKPNCIYFSDDSQLLVPTTRLDVGIYDCQNLKLEKQRERNSDFRVRMKPFPKSKDGRNLLLSSLSHIWIVPFPYHH
ncbi:hypothetical protein CXB51_025025 [Gossypium anomalum]|uniref:KIB1-4 beta-propeller domain-containing protein n=1 Tax=Gossypium anomalum TaxID=47600 RepID=A0A8J5Y0D0_9ROSI|nr:hypothetical protein CXB51_025025 [Gossypium anomalum]